MADNVDITPGTGATVAADLVGGVLYQRVKVAIGADGTAADWPVGSGDQSAVPRVTLATDSPGIISTVAHDAADSGDPLKIGARAAAGLTSLTLVSAADRTDLIAGLDGALHVRNVSLTDIVTGNASNTDGATTSCLAASGDAAIKTYLQSIILTNMSATAIYVEIKDDTTVKLTIPLPAGSGCVVNLPVPIPGTANKAWFFDPSAAATTVYCSMVGFKSKV